MTVNFIIETTDETENSGKYLLLVEGRPFYIGAVVRQLLLFRAKHQDLTAITTELNEWARGQYEFTLQEVSSLLEGYVQRLGLRFDGTTSGRISGGDAMRTGIFGQWTLLSYDRMRPIVAVLRYAFQPWIFYPILCLAVIFNVFYTRQLIELHNNLASLQSAATGAAASVVAACGKDAMYVLLFYPAAFAILLFHELGHAAAAYNFGIKPKKIGAGFYLVFPVLFADITEAWRLNRNRRLIVNMAGIYLQLLVNLVLIYAVYNTSNYEYVRLIRYLMILNIGTMILNLNFILKFDGYWIYSDLFKIPNLMGQSHLLMGMTLEKIIPNYQAGIPDHIREKVQSRNVWLILFTLFRLAFYVMFTYYMIAHLIPSASGGLATSMGYIWALDFSVCNLEFIGKTLVTSSVAGYLTYRYGKVLVNKIRK